MAGVDLWSSLYRPPLVTDERESPGSSRSWSVWGMSIEGHPGWNGTGWSRVKTG